MGDDAFRPGDRVGTYEVVRLLGTGGFAQVYEVVDPRGARLALKTLATHAEARPKLRARLAQEGAALSMIEHRHVVRLFDSGFHGDRVYLVLELVLGRDLRAALERAPGAAAVVRWIRDAADGLAEAHAFGVVHRDLKPENLLVTDEGEIKVIDFGIAKLASAGVKTSNQQRLGTALYMAPEQLCGAEPEGRMDVYALALVLYEALAGGHPIVEGPATVYEICARQIYQRAAPFAEAAPWAPRSLAALLDAGLAKDPLLRPTMRAFADGLSAALPLLSAEPDPSAATPVMVTSARGAGAAVPSPATAPSPPATGPFDAEDGTTVELTTAPIAARALPAGPDPTVAAPAPPARADRPAPLGGSRWIAALLAAALGGSAGVGIVERLRASLRAPAASTPPPGRPSAGR